MEPGTGTWLVARAQRSLWKHCLGSRASAARASTRFSSSACYSARPSFTLP
jgi:hypothetical protein